MMQMPAERLYTVSELSNAEWFPYKRQKIIMLVANGEIKAKRFGFRTIRIPESSVKEYFKKHSL